MAKMTRRTFLGSAAGTFFIPARRVHDEGIRLLTDKRRRMW